MMLRNATTGQVVASDVKVAESWIDRMTGFLRRRQVAPEEGLFFKDCSIIHTMGMRAAIDVVFLDSQNRVLRIVCSVRPNRFALACAGASAVVELGSGALESSDVLTGDRLTLEE